jgi:hypothetical protein
MLVTITTTGGQWSIDQSDLPWSNVTTTSSAYSYDVTANDSASWWNVTLCSGLILTVNGQPAGGDATGCNVTPA